ncbi:MAG: hypothetical protein QXD59_08290 [Candidatus Caldarchaeum sp.]
MRPIAEQYLTHIVGPTLAWVGLDSPSARHLLLGTLAVESGMGRWIVQRGGPALSPYQIEPATALDVWDRICRRYPRHAERGMRFLLPELGIVDQLPGNILFATVLARFVYFLDPHPLPPPDDIGELGKYWKQAYNRSGRGTVDRFVSCFKRYVWG